MTNKVRAKFRCTETTNHAGGAKRVKLEAVYDQDIPEDRRFCEATPSGEFSMYVDNATAAAFIEPGRSYYLDLIAVPEAQGAKG